MNHVFDTNDLLGGGNYSPVMFDALAPPPATAAVAASVQEALMQSPTRLQDLFALRQQIYENKELFHQHAVSEQPDADAPPVNDAFDVLEKHIEEGRQHMSDTILRYNALLSQKEIYDTLMQTLSINTSLITRNIADNQSLLSNMIATESNMEPLVHTIDTLNACMSNIEACHTQALDCVKSQCIMPVENELKVVNKKIHRCAKAFGILKNASMGHTCPICLTNDVSYYTAPCGHTVCKDCRAQLRTKCFMCRKNIDACHPLFFN